MRWHQVPGKGQRAKYNEQQRRQDSARPSFVEVFEGERPLVNLRQYERSNQVTADHEKQVDADISSREPGRARMKQYDWYDGYRPQAIYVRSIGDTRQWCLDDLLLVLTACSAVILPKALGADVSWPRYSNIRSGYW